MSKRHTNGSYVMYSTCIAGDITMIVNGKKMYSPQEFDEVFKALKDTIEDLELRADVHKTLTGEEIVVPMSDSRYRKAKDVIAKFNRVEGSE